MTHEDYKELLAVHAMTALAAENARALETHLEGCADCRSEMEEWQRTAAFIALDARPDEPSPQLREQILTSIRSESLPSVENSHQETSRVLPFESRRSLRTSLGSFGAIAASLIIVGLLVALALLWQQNRSTRLELEQLSAQLRESNDQLARERAIVTLLSSPGARMTELAGTNLAPGARAMLAYDKNGHAMLMAKGLPATPAGMAYQLWFIKDNKKMPGKVFTTDPAGDGILEDQIPSVALDSAVFAITLEPKTGVQVPTGAIYLVSAS